MTSCDTNVFAYALNPDAPENALALRFLPGQAENPTFAVSEIVLVELYNLLRNGAVLRSPLSPSQAVDQVERLRSNPYWTILKGAVDVSDAIWKVAGTRDFPRRAIFDARLAHSLAAEGVTRFATRNVGDFRRFEAFEAFDPLVEVE